MLITILALSAISSVVFMRMNTNEVVSQESQQELEMKRQMLEQFMQKQQGTQGESSAAATETTPSAQ